ncbi:GNAT family N-acetyltransferase [Hahella aquimaris]|uniref:GNAT family N-acetyltransferase n=1 Tax=Hahella sp. HNIBRBA332 TaxID=3015983 RepID=UPI00273BAD73|nr:GNAT family N-acetyltransferase [Hahella sp. HNIBRBA332]WLQ11390.1 GNAT family N-acetyltransferase [Hahella sp. HNIBRBA332]
MKNTLAKIKDVKNRHKERRTPLGLEFAIADSINFLNAADWDRIAASASVFLQRDYLQALELNAPDNVSPRYGLIYKDRTPIGVVSCQIADVSGDRMIKSEKPDNAKAKLTQKYQERILVCGNLVSCGLHGVAFAEGVDAELGWRALAELLYRIRRGEKLGGSIDFVMLKDFNSDMLPQSDILKRYSYRSIQTDPEMVLTLEPGTRTFEDYLQSLTGKYRKRITAIIKKLQDAGVETQTLDSISDEQDAALHALYLQVENRAAARLATLPKGYFKALSDSLGDRFACTTLSLEGRIVGFVTSVKDRDTSMAYYVGLDYDINADLPLYFRLLQLSIEHGCQFGCSKVSLGRTALEPKANLGAKPVDCHLWMRHRAAAVNYVVRKLFRAIPHAEAPTRNALKTVEQ